MNDFLYSIADKVVQVEIMLNEIAQQAVFGLEEATHPAIQKKHDELKQIQQRADRINHDVVSLQYVAERMLEG
jgi:cupin superfamily acireductone dioxygenase involved in methionine salvage